MNRHIKAVITGMMGMREASAKSACHILASNITLLDMLQQMSAKPMSTNPTKSTGSPQWTNIMTSPSTKAAKPKTSAHNGHITFSPSVYTPCT